ncbi:hypothetical protein [Methylobacterium sp. R2-1]|uniref:hypothetical protein n=1 Tax=Methylobacterium sp. R2-1 TaxID=2587064 RepID=UPI0016153F6E|nr:hypothetical protein [Methylobacterium sp. R2-1]MBB2964246.1 hypothetical protein [Methylobacterium sp. R2-1]
MSRHNFSDENRHVIAARAGFRCSYPGCNQLTIGPAKSSDTFENTGFGCHIYSASEKGPRGQGLLTPEQIKHPTNGIWMCGSHENLIDKKSGVRFPVHTLQSWKALHEYRTSYEHSGRQAAFGFVKQIKMLNTPLFGANALINLAKTTFLIGRNGTGKSAICEWLTVLDTGRNLNRWLECDDLEYIITFDAPAEHQLQAKIAGGILDLNLDKCAVSRNYARSATVFLKDRGDPNIFCDLKKFMDLFGIEEQALRSLIAQVSSNFINRLYFSVRSGDADEAYDGERTSPIYEMRCELARGDSFSFLQLSGGEQGRILLEIAMAMAQEAVQFGPVLMIVELNSLGIDWGAIKPYLAHFANGDCLYQTIITSYGLPTNIEMLGWQIYTFEDDKNGKYSVAPTLVG